MSFELRTLVREDYLSNLKYLGIMGDFNWPLASPVVTKAV